MSLKDYGAIMLGCPFRTTSRSIIPPCNPLCHILGLGQGPSLQPTEAQEKDSDRIS